jgi:hypothetical protein
LLPLTWIVFLSTVQVGHEYHWGSKVQKTHKKKETLSPEWNETFEMSAKSQDKDVVKFSVLDHDLIGSDETLGFAELPITNLIQGLEWLGWLPLTRAGKHHGDIQIGVTAMNFGRPAPAPGFVAAPMPMAGMPAPGY